MSSRMTNEAKYDVLFARVSDLRELCAIRNEVDPEQLVDSIEKVLGQVRSCDPNLDRFHKLLNQTWP